MTAFRYTMLLSIEVTREWKYTPQQRGFLQGKLSKHRVLNVRFVQFVNSLSRRYRYCIRCWLYLLSKSFMFVSTDSANLHNRRRNVHHLGRAECARMNENQGGRSGIDTCETRRLLLAGRNNSSVTPPVYVLVDRCYSLHAPFDLCQQPTELQRMIRAQAVFDMILALKPGHRPLDAL